MSIKLLSRIKVMKIILFVLFSCPFYIIAQKDTSANKPFTLDLGTNLVSLPTGSFAGTGSNGGYAAKNLGSVVLNNISVFLELKYSPKTPIVTNILGLKSTTIFAARISGFSIGFDTKSFDQNLSNTLPGIAFQSVAKDYRMLNFMLGFYDLYNITKKPRFFYFYDRIFLGISNTNLPAIATSANGLPLISRSSGSATAFSFQYGIGIHKNLTKKFSAGIGIDYFYTRPIFKNIETRTSAGVLTYKDISAPISILTTMSISFGCKF